MAPLDELCEAAEVLAHAARSMAIQMVYEHVGEI